MLEKNGDTTMYTYDYSDRLSSVTYPSGKKEGYIYDGMGNRLKRTIEDGAAVTNIFYTYNAENQLISSSDGMSYSYDSNGNLITKEDSKGVTTYGYDFDNRLTKVTTPDATLSFNYCSCPTLTGIDGYGAANGCSACADSPSGKRISKTVNNTTMYTICFDPTMDFDENGNIIARYVQNPTMLDEPISIETAGGKYYYLFDGLGSVTGLTDSGGSLVATYKYDAFGNIISETGDATLNAINPYRFTSRVYDKESGLYYYRARYYDAKVGRFTQKDPLRDAWNSGENLYVYCGNNPVNWKDPTGLLRIVTDWKCVVKKATQQIVSAVAVYFTKIYLPSFPWNVVVIMCIVPAYTLFYALTFIPHLWIPCLVAIAFALTLTIAKCTTVHWW